ncbi:MAG: mitomycin resistance protein, partial [Planctomycetota bacterium]|nr:mitomycin resistance protein [Planctomycetota bacterium]
MSMRRPTAAAKDPMDQLRREFMKMPNVGKATAGDLLLLGIRSIEQLATQDPMDLYERLCVLQK